MEIVESPAVPQEPIKPKRLKIMALVLAGSLMAGAGATFLAEFADKSIRRTNQLLTVVDGQLVLSIPYIVTAAELRSQKRRRFIVLFASILLVAVGLCSWLICSCRRWIC